MSVLKLEIVKEVKNNESKVLACKPSLLEPTFQPSYEYLGVPGFQKPITSSVSFLSVLLNLLWVYDKTV